MEIVGAVIAVTAATVRTTSAVWSLCDAWREAPAELHRLLEDLRCAQQFFGETQEGIQHSPYLTNRSGIPSATNDMQRLLGDGADVIKDIGHLVERLRRGPRDDGGGWEELRLEEVGKRRRAMWLRQTWKVTRLRKRLKNVTARLCHLLVAQNVAVSADIRASVEDSKEEIMSHVGQRLEYTEDAISELGNALCLSQKTSLLFMDQRFTSMEARMVTSVREPIRDELALLRKELSHARQPPTTPSRPPQATFPASNKCPLTCRCHCHFTRAMSRFCTHPSLGPLLGALTLTLASNALSPRPCSDRACIATQQHHTEPLISREVSLTLSLPPWLLRASLTLLYTSHPRPELLLRVFHHLPTGVPSAAHNIFGCLDRNDLAGVQRLLSTRQASVYDVRYTRAVSPLFAATERKQVAMVKLLLQAGADPFQATTDGATPVLSALQAYLSGCPEGRELATLLPVFSSNTALDLSPLHLATIGILPLSLPHALSLPHFLAHLNQLNLNSYYAPLHLASIRGDPPAVAALLRAGAKVDLPGGRAKTPLNYACAWGHYRVAKILLDAGADVNSRDSYGITPLVRAAGCQKSELRLLELLVERGAEVDARANDMSTPLGHAVAYGCLEAAEFLLGRGADVDARDGMGDVPMVEAVVSGFHEGARLLLRYGCALGGVNGEGMGVVHHLAAVGDEEMMGIFRGQGGLRGWTKGEGKTPLEIFNERESTLALREAFYELLEGGQEGETGHDEDGGCESDEEDEFVDAMEVLEKK